MKYFKEIDVFKGIAIILIILLHSQCEFPIDLRNSTDLHIVRSAILFLSPNALFFFASGFLFYRSMEQDYFLFMKKKALRLLIPMVAFSIMAFSLKKIGSSLIHSPSNDTIISWLQDVLTGNYYWFLYSLFFLFLINKLSGKFRWLIALVMVIMSIFFVTNKDMTTLEKTIYYNIFFYLGATIGSWRLYSRISSAIKNHKLYSCVFVITILFGGCMLVDIFFVHDSISHIYLQHYLFPILAASGLWVFSILISENRVLAFFGKYSLQYYLNHLLIILGAFYTASFLYRYIHSYWLALGVVMLFAISLSTVMLFVEKRLTKLKILFGL